MTLYTPKIHKLDRLRQLANAVSAALISIWPRSQKFYNRCFGRLLRAYVEARYSPHYEISAEETAWLYQRIELLQALVKDICEAHLAGNNIKN